MKGATIGAFFNSELNKMSTGFFLLFVACALSLGAGLGILVYRQFFDKRVDPWAMQAMLMDASAQGRPHFPMLTNNAVLYAALIMEESAETFQALSNVLLRVDARGEHDDRIQALFTLLGAAAESNKVRSESIRDVLKMTPAFSIALNDDDANELFDGTTDVAVVNCGFALACGFPGSAGYLEVASSNLSKCNPLTGVIDKDPSGKWIKGSEYRAPNLAGVLASHGI